jgi:hypothetical protein
MKISEILSENQKCIPGWQESETILLPLNKGLVILSHRLNKNCEIDELLFVYHNKNIIGIDNDNEHGWIVSVKVKNGQVIVYDYFKFPKGKNKGPFTSVKFVKTLFDSLVQPYL